jgi:hypothetical protein
MRYVQRNEKGEVIAHFANEQSYAVECIPVDHPDIEDFKRRRDFKKKTPSDVHVNSTMIKSAWARGMARFLAKHLNMTEAELVLAIKAEAAEPYLGKPGMSGADAWKMEGYE